MTPKQIKALREIQRTNLENKYMALFYELYDIEGLEYGVKSYVFKRIMFGGTIAAFNMKLSDVITEKLLAFGPYAEQGYDWKDDPIKAKPMNSNQTNLIPKKYLEVNKEIVLLRLPFIPYNFIKEYVEIIMDIEATIRTNLNTLKMPYALQTLNKTALNAIMNILNDEQIVTLNQLDMQVLNTATPYVIDKLQRYRNEKESELLTVLGIDNVKFEKAAQMNVDEITANDDEINAYRNVISNRIEAFIEQLNEVLGHNLKFVKKHLELGDPNENPNKEGEDDDETI